MDTLNEKFENLREVSLNQTIFMGLARAEEDKKRQAEKLADDRTTAQSSHPKLIILQQLLSDHFEKSRKSCACEN